MDDEKFGPLSFLVGEWESKGWTGENKALDPDREEENTKFRQIMSFTPIDDVENHEQVLCVLRYSTTAWEEGDENPFHEEVGYWIWDAENKQVMKSFIVPRGISVNAGGTSTETAKSFKVQAKVGSDTYSVASNLFLDREFKTLQYDLEVTQLNEQTFRYSEDTQIKMKGRPEIFHHTEKNTMVKIHK
ncbi:MAG: FABP family protein [Bdellovibrio sp. CG12_big_fil_rev_8_21_14_0_65_39_13]|nr:MAG: FABP family protein [Bdellovibrio sp. CG22_combo_CG10-13_8_21_14_all_39_27]PIQ60323.1 MAG: FABP family protein [Bdellovibrio sp. CG12_big_fil_rev_8_21_14_0_65_39_13]PIR35068.1 MAG: FABP family protein [Bdellovibrio sp. CG11_big_fil_rev_8_21_14_0_20_39_38]PJB53840.1 MAG: FABP family protein [Bdellovibrio sp. CG_4_9_14_3_um_filter_39_7]